MPPGLTTSSHMQALVRGFGLSAAMILFLWLVDLPLDWKFVAIVLPVCGLSSSIAFYDGSKSAAPRSPAVVMMRNVHWDFSEPPNISLEEFVRTVSAAQSTDSEWIPEQRLALPATIRIHVPMFHWDDDCERIIELQTQPDAGWTQAELLHAIHCNIHWKDLGDHMYFEGLSEIGGDQYHLWLGS